MRCPWFVDHARQVHLDFHVPEFPPEAIRRFDPDAFVEHLQRGRVNMVALFAKCHFGNCYYDTAIGHRHAGLDCDFLMETATRCRERGIRTLAYYSLCWEKRAWDENPDWRAVNAEGKVVGGESGAWGAVCMNSGYKDGLVMPQLREIADRYPVDGFFLDIPFTLFGHDVERLCYCATCRHKWKVELGIDLTPQTPLRTRQRLLMRTVEQYLQEIRQIIDETNPALVLCVNQVAKPVFNRRVKELCEIGVWESQPRPGDYLGHSFAARLGRNDICDLQIMTVRFHEGWGDLTLKPTPQLTTECAAMIGNGAVCNVGDQVNVDGTLQPPVYDALGESFGLVQRMEPVLRGAESVRHAMALLPVMDPELPFHAAFADAVSSRTLPPWRGVHKLLVESHIQVDLGYSVFAEDLSPFPLVILPGPGGYPREVIERLSAYVRGGGTLVAVGDALLRDGRHELEDLFGIEYVEPFACARPEAQAIHFVPREPLRSATGGMPLQFRGQAYKVRLRGGDELAAIHLPQAPYQPPHRAFRSKFGPAMRERSPFPFATRHRFGKGTAVYIAGDIFGVYWRTNHPWLRSFMETLLRYVDPTMPYEIDASGSIEANLMRRDGDLLLNLVHYAPGHAGDARAIASIERVEPAHNIACRVRCGRVGGVVVEPEGEHVAFEHVDGVCSFNVPRIEYLTTVRLIGAASN